MKINYYTTLDWGNAEAKKATPTGYDFEIHNTEIPTLARANSVIFRIYCLFKGYSKDGHVHYIGDYSTWKKNRSKKDKYRGQHYRFLNKSYIRSFVKKNGYICFADNDDTANWCRKNKKGARPQWIYTPQHENLHMKSKDLKKKDRLHEWIGLGKYDKYESDYLNDKVIKDVLPLVKRKFKEFEKLMDMVGDPIKLVSGYRSFEEQDKLYAQGRTERGNIVTNAKGGESMHNFGASIDYCFKNPPAYPKSMDKRWVVANVIATVLGFYSYGLNELWDDGHIQYMFDYSEKDFRDGKVDYSLYL